MGVVYLAYDSRLDRRVAIKVLPESLAGDSHMRERLRREAMAAAALDHPFICKIFEIGEHGGALFLVMEYIDGETLWAKLRGGRMPTQVAIRIASEMADALEQAHGQGFVHRDLKPANIMLTVQGHVKVMELRTGQARRGEGLGARRHRLDRTSVNRARRGRRYARVYVAGAGDGAGAGCQERPVFVGYHPGRDAGRKTSISHGEKGAAGDNVGNAREAAGFERRHSAGA